MERGTCMELALEGERLCKCGDFEGGVAFFVAAVKVGTDDLRTLSAIYSQLGNAYFYLGDYEKALDYHKLDVTVAKSMGDKVGEGKASGNLGNALKMLGQFEEAITCCSKHLVISRELNDKVGEGRALYNLGNVYHTQGKHMAKLGHEDPGDFPEAVKQCLLNAVHYYEQNLALMTQLGDKSAQGRAYGNLGNTHYLLGNFTRAVSYHQERLNIAREFGDKAAERRAQCNLGNAHIFLGEFEEAVNNYKETLRLAQELADRLVEAQACYSLGNTFTLLREYKSAVEYHIRHLAIAQELRDRVGEGRACWSVGNALKAIGEHEEALAYANRHLSIARELGDKPGEASAQNSISDLRKLLEQTREQEEGAVGGEAMSIDSKTQLTSKRSKRFSMDNMQLLKMTPDTLLDEAASSNFHLNLLSESESKLNNKDTRKTAIPQHSASLGDDSARDGDRGGNGEGNGGGGGGGGGADEYFLELLSRFQSKRMDDQRCAFNPLEDKENRRPGLNERPTKPPRNGRRSATGVNNGNPSNSAAFHRSSSNPGNYGMTSDHDPHAEDYRRSSNPVTDNPHARQPNNDNPGPGGRGAGGGVSAASSSSTASATTPTGDNTCRDELFDLIAGLQSRRMDEQRAPLPPLRRSYTTNGPESLPGHGSRSDRVHHYGPGPGNHNNNNPRALQRMATTEGNESSEAMGGGLNHRQSRQMSLTSNVQPDDDFFELIMRSQGSRLEEQRSHLPCLLGSSSTSTAAPLGSASSSGGLPGTGSRAASNETVPLKRPTLERPLSIAPDAASPQPLSTVPDDDFFSLIMRFQTSGRIEDQRSTLPQTQDEARGGQQGAALDDDDPMRRGSGSSNENMSRKGSFEATSGQDRRSSHSRK